MGRRRRKGGRLRTRDPSDTSSRATARIRSASKTRSGNHIADEARRRCAAHTAAVGSITLTDATCAFDWKLTANEEEEDRKRNITCKENVLCKI